MADFGKGAVSVVVLQLARAAFKQARHAVITLMQFVVAAHNRALGAVIHETTDEQIKAAVVIVIKPNGGSGPVRVR